MNISAVGTATPVLRKGFARAVTWLARNGMLAAAAAGTFATATPALAGTVMVAGDHFDLNIINSFYNSYGGHSSTIAGSGIAGADLSGVDLLWMVQPAVAFGSTELEIMSSFLADGGRIAFMGEHGSFRPAENLRINDALGSLGATMSIVNTIVDAGGRLASTADGQILAHPLTAGVSSYSYGAFAPLTITGTAQALMVGEAANTIMMAYQNIGPGSVFLFTDQNVWDGSTSLWGDRDNEVMFDNLVDGVTGAPPVAAIPEPATWAMLILGMGLVGGALRGRRSGQTSPSIA